MDDKQFESIKPMVHAADAVAVQCSNLKNRLKLAAGEIKKQIKADKNPKEIFDAAGKFHKQVEAAHTEIMKCLKISEKDLRKMSIPEYKKKLEKMIGLIGGTSNAAAAYWDSYKKSRAAGSGIGACASASASNVAAELLIKAATKTKIKFNQMK